MNKNAIRVAAASLVTVPILAMIGAGTANATDATVVGGREKVKVTVHNTTGADMSFPVTIPGHPVSGVDVPANGTSSVVIYDVAPGAHTVTVVGLAGVYPVTVDAANPLLDVVDGVLKGAGSSGMATDRALN